MRACFKHDPVDMHACSCRKQSLRRWTQPFGGCARPRRAAAWMCPRMWLRSGGKVVPKGGLCSKCSLSARATVRHDCNSCHVLLNEIMTCLCFMCQSAAQDLFKKKVTHQYSRSRRGCLKETQKFYTKSQSQTVLKLAPQLARNKTKLHSKVAHA